MKPVLLTYRHVWTRGSSYQYYCTWSDGSEGFSVSLPWGSIGDAVELPMATLGRDFTPTPTPHKEPQP